MLLWWRQWEWQRGGEQEAGGGEVRSGGSGSDSGGSDSGDSGSVSGSCSGVAVTVLIYQLYIDLKQRSRVQISWFAQLYYSSS